MMNEEFSAGGRAGGAYRSAPWGDGHAVVVPYAGQRRARLMVTAGVGGVWLRGDPSATALVTVDSDGVRPPRVRAYDDEVWLQGPRSLSEWLSAWFDGHEHYDVTLHPSVAWEVVVRGGVCGLHGRLDDVDLARVEFSGGCSEVDLSLPRPRQPTVIRMRGGVADLRLRRPADVPVQVSVRGGATSLQVDAQHYGAVGGHVRIDAPGGGGDTPGYLVELSGGASSVEVTKV